MPAVGSQVGRPVGFLNVIAIIAHELTTDAPVDGNVEHFI
jgi:hypothetical protein